MGITIWDAAADAGAVPGLGTAAVRAFERFMATMAALRERAPSSRSRSATCSRRVLHETGYLDALEAERTIEAQGRIENLEELVEVAREFDAARRQRGHASTSSCSRSRSSPTPTRARDDEGLVTLMTLHNAKGLEYPIVFMIGCEEGVFPHSRSLDEGDARGGAPPLLRRDHARDARPLPDPRAPAHRLRLARPTGCRAASSPRSRRT